MRKEITEDTTYWEFKKMCKKRKLKGILDIDVIYVYAELSQKAKEFYNEYINELANYDPEASLIEIGKRLPPIIYYSQGS